MFSVKKQALTVSAALAAFALTFGAPVLGHAAYQLNSEVKDATPALKEASAIGVRNTIPKLYKTCQTKMLWLL